MDDKKELRLVCLRCGRVIVITDPSAIAEIEMLSILEDATPEELEFICNDCTGIGVSQEMALA